MRRIILLLTIILISINACCAEKIPLKVRPISPISTVYDELEVGDILSFEVTRDVYKGDKLFIPQGAQLLGKIDYVSENGWCFDNAQIELKKFEIKLSDGRSLEFDSELTIDGFEMLKYYYPKWKRFFEYIGAAFRGKEIDLAANSDVIFNVWYHNKK